MQIIFVEPFNYYSKGDIYMRIGDEVYISPKFTAAYYLEIGLTLKSNKETWRKAVGVLRDRINGRYFQPIGRLIQFSSDMRKFDNVETNGFAAMSLMCLLIDTFMQFRYGFPQAPSNKANFFYKRFMTECLNYEEVEACRFYNDIRCGLLHSAETKNGSYLVPYFEKRRDVSGLNRESELNKAIRIVDNGSMRDVVSVSVKGLYDELKFYFDTYCVVLLDGTDKMCCREAFISKMNSIVAKPDLYAKDKLLWDAIYANQRRSISSDGLPSFRYKCDNLSMSLDVIKDDGYDTVFIPFTDIKDYFYCPDDGIRSCIANSVYIKQILDLCPKEVNRFKNYIKGGIRRMNSRTI